MIKMRYEERPNSDVKVLGEITSVYKDLFSNIGKIVRSDEYVTGKFRIVEFYDKSGRLVMKSELVGISVPYDYRIETYYNVNGDVVSSIRYRRTYDENGLLLSEEIEE